MAHMTPFDVPEEADMGRPVLDGRNGGEESMMSFVRHHIVTALQPVSQGLLELEQRVAHMSKDLSLTDTKVDEHQQSLQNLVNDMMAMRNSHNTMSSLMNQTHVKLEKEAEIRNKVESDLDATKFSVAKANERHQHCMATVESLDRKLGHLNNNFGNLKDLVAQAEGDIQRQTKDLSALKDAHGDLTTHHAGTTTKLQQTTEVGEACVRDLAKLVASHQHHCEETGISVDNLNQHLTEVHRLLNATVDLTDKDRAELKQNAEFLKSVRQGLGHKDNSCLRLDAMQNRDDEMYNALKKHLESFENLQHLVESLSGGSLGGGGEGGSQPRAGGGLDLLEELRVKVEAHDGSIDKMGGVQAKHVEQLKDAIMAIEKLQRDSRRIKDYADGTQNELAGLVTSHKQANSRMDHHTIDHNRLQSDVETINSDVGSTLKQVKGDLGNTSAALAKLRSHYDAANTNMFGLAKGFQDAGRHVVGNDTRSRSQTARGSPTATMTMRTPRGPSQANDTLRSLTGGMP